DCRVPMVTMRMAAAARTTIMVELLEGFVITAPGWTLCDGYERRDQLSGLATAQSQFAARNLLVRHPEGNRTRRVEPCDLFRREFQIERAQRAVELIERARTQDRNQAVRRTRRLVEQ